MYLITMERPSTLFIDILYFRFLGSATIARSGIVHKWWIRINIAASAGCRSAYTRKRRTVSIVVQFNVFICCTGLFMFVHTVMLKISFLCPKLKIGVTSTSYSPIHNTVPVKPLPETRLHMCLSESLNTVGTMWSHHRWGKCHLHMEQHLKKCYKVMFLSFYISILCSLTQRYIQLMFLLLNCLW
jgi:hypothetical protein